MVSLYDHVRMRALKGQALRASHSGLLACLALLGRGAHVTCVPRLQQRQSFSHTLVFDAMQLKHTV